MNVGKLTITSSGEEDIVFILHVDNNDANLVNQIVNLNTLQNIDNINGFDALGNDMSLIDFIQSLEELGVFIDAKKTAQLVFNFVDSGISLKTYDLKVSLIYEQDIKPTYEEAVEKAELQKKAAEIIAK